MRRHRLPLTLGVLGLICGNIIGALINILTGRMGPDSPYQIYIVPSLIGFLMVSVGVYIWQYRAEHAPEPAEVSADQAQRNRQILINKVRAAWIDGVLMKSLYKEAQLNLGMVVDPAKVDIPLRAYIQEMGGQHEDLPRDTTITPVYDRFGGALLILGAPGGGKTTKLLELTRDLLVRAEQQSNHAVPVVFNLSSWGVNQQPLAQWIATELNQVYDVSPKLAQEWVSRELILPLLDGLDEVARDARDACVTAINTFHARYTSSLVVCSRLEEYGRLIESEQRLRLQGAIILQALTRAEVQHVLDQIGARLAGLREALVEEPELWRFAVNPLSLSILALAYRGKSATDIGVVANDAARFQHLFAAYVDAMLARGTKPPLVLVQRRHWWMRRKARPAFYTREQTMH